MAKRILPGSWSLLGTWQRLEVPSRAPPISELVLKGLAGYAWSCQRYDIACLLLTGFHAMLRAGEMLGITREAVAIHTETSGVLALP